MLIDLHMHSNSSDGQYSPSELIDLSERKQLQIIALTDHDTVNGISEAKERARSSSVKFIPGIEISSREYEEVHILGLGIDEKNQRLLDATAEMMKDRSNRCLKISDYLATRDIIVDLQEIYSIAGEGSVGRPHFAEYLQRHGYVRTKQEAFDRYIDTPSFHEATDRVLPTPKDAIDLIHNAGGVAILAHPGLLKKGKAKQEAFLLSLKEEGLDGIEVFYSKHSYPQTKYYASLAERLGLYISIGSDFHGENVKPAVKLGMQLEQYYYRFLPHNIVS